MVLKQAQTVGCGVGGNPPTSENVVEGQRRIYERNKYLRIPPINKTFEVAGCLGSNGE